MRKLRLPLIYVLIAAAVSASLATGCYEDTKPADEYTVGGQVSGLEGTGLVLSVNDGEQLPISASGSFEFTTALADGAAYVLTVETQPSDPDQVCTISNGSGTIAGSNVTDVTVVCSSVAYPIGGTVAGLLGTGLVLQNNAGDDLTVSADGTFTFSTEAADGAGYDVTVLTQPNSPNQVCTVTSGAGTVNGAAITDVQVTCSTEAYAVGGTVTGLAGTGLVLQNNAGDDLAISADGAFTFSTDVADGSGFDVTVLTQPSSPNQLCTVTSGAGTMAGVAVGDVQVTCVTETYAVGGTVNGLDGTGLVLQNSGGDDLTVTGDGPFVFSAEVVDGSGFDVTILQQPSGTPDYCIVLQGSGTVDGTDITSVVIDCLGPENIGVGPDLWLRAEDVTVGDGSSMATWPDVGTHSLDATQPIAANMPTYRATGGPGNMPYVEFDGVSDYLAGSAVPLASDTYTALLVVEIPDQTSNNIGIFTMCQNSGHDYENGFTLTVAGPDNTAVFVHSDAGMSFGNIGLAPTWQLITLTYGAGTATAHVNGAPAGTDGYTDATINTERYILGARSPDSNANVNYWAPNRHTEVIVFKGVLSTTDREDVECYLIDKYDLGMVASNPSCP